MWAEGDHYLPKKGKFAKNPLLRHSRVGKPRERTDKYPPESFTYGRPAPTGEPSAGEVIHQWKFHSPNEEAKPSRDFVRTNQKAADFGCINAKQNATFRYNKMYRQRKGPFPNKEEDSLHQKLEKMTFGMKNPVSTPIQRVITGEFQRSFINHQKKVLKPKATDKRLPRDHTATKHNWSRFDREKCGHYQSATPELFKMKQFRDVGSRVEIPNPRFRHVEEESVEAQEEVAEDAPEVTHESPEEITCD